jgi:competence protein ComEA
MDETTNQMLIRYRRVAVLGAILSLAVGGVVGYFLPHPAPDVPIIISTPLPSPVPSPIPTPAPIRVYVSGAVHQPAVYELPPGSIVQDALDAAGGPAPDADLDRINLALELRDQQQVHVPRQGERDPPPPISGGEQEDQGTVPEGPININTATTAELQVLPRIGPVTAQDIVDYREANGPFETIEEIQDVPGIGPATFEGIKDLITTRP